MFTLDGSKPVERRRGEAIKAPCSTTPPLPYSLASVPLRALFLTAGLPHLTVDGNQAWLKEGRTSEYA